MHVETFIVLFAVATAVALGARWLKLPYTIALVLAGLAVGASGVIEHAHLTHELLFSVILPGLIFEAAFHLDAKSFWRERVAISSLAVPGLLVAIIVTAVVLTPVANAVHATENFTLGHAFVFAALIAATDPIAVVGLFKSLGAPKRLAVLVEGESLINDGTGVVIFTIAVSAVAGGEFSIGASVLEFFKVAGLGAVVGVVLGYGAAQIIKRVDDAMIELTVTVVAAYGSFAVAEHLHLSGVIATVAAGMLCGNYAARIGMSPTTRVAVETFWEYLAFALNSIVFLLIGAEVSLGTVLASWKAIVVAYLAVTLGRAVIVYVVTALLRPSRMRIPWRWAAVLTWSGLRGALSMVLVLGLPADFPQRELLVHMTFGVVLLSILVQGLTTSPLLRKLGVATVLSKAAEKLEEQRARVYAAQGALDELERVRHERVLHAEVLDEVEEEFQRRLADAEEGIKQLHLAEKDLRTEDERAVRRRILIAERDALTTAYRKGLVDESGYQVALAEVDAKLDAMREA